MLAIPTNKATKRITKASIKAELRPCLDKAWAECRDRIAAMQDQAHNPQVALMIEKNKGYLMALEDMTELLYSKKIF